MFWRTMLAPLPPSWINWKLPGPTCALPGAALFNDCGAFSVYPQRPEAPADGLPQTSIGARLQAVLMVGLGPATAEAATVNVVIPLIATSDVGSVNPVASTR